MATKTNSNKEKRQKLILELTEAENQLGWLEYTEIPRLVKELKKLGITKREIEENNLEDTINLHENKFTWKSIKK